MNKQATKSAVIDNETGKALPVEPTKAIAVPEETTKGIAELKSFVANLKQIATVHAADPDCSTKEGYDDAKEKLSDVSAVRIAGEKARVGAKKFHLDQGKLIDGWNKQIVAVTAPIEKKYSDAIKVVDDELARIELEEANAAQLHIDYCTSCIKNIQDLAKAVSLDAVEHSLDTLEKFNIAEMTGHEEVAQESIDEARAELTDRRATLQAQADQQAENDRQSLANAAAAKELADQRAELKRGQDELANSQAAEATRKENEAKAAQDKIDTEKANKAAEEKRLADKAQKAKDDKAEEKRRADLLPEQEKLMAWVDGIADFPRVRKAESKAKVAELDQAIVDMRESIRSMTAEK